MWIKVKSCVLICTHLMKYLYNYKILYYESTLKMYTLSQVLSSWVHYKDENTPCLSFLVYICTHEMKYIQIKCDLSLTIYKLGCFHLTHYICARHLNLPVIYYQSTLYSWILIFLECTILWMEMYKFTFSFQH